MNRRVYRFAAPALSAALATAFAVASCSPKPTPTPPTPPTPEDIGHNVPPPRVDRSKLPEPWQVADWAPPAVEVSELSNGMKVYFLKQGLMPIVSVLLVFPAGSGTDPVGKEGLASLTADMLDEGAGKRSALEISEELQRLATDYAGYAQTDAVVLSVNSLTDAFPQSIAILSDIARRPTFPRAEFKRRKKQRIAAARAREEDPRFVRDLVVRRGLFGDGYAGGVSQGTKSTLERIRYSDVKRQYQAAIQPSGAAVVVTGNVDKALAIAELEKSFGDWKGKPTAKARPVAKAAAKKAIHFVNFPGKPQSAIALARRAGDADTPEYFPAMLFNRVFGGAFTSRLNLNLREDKGYTYGARSSFARGRETGMFSLRANVKADTTQASLEESIKELKGLCANAPLTEAERDKAAGGLLLGFPSRFENVSSVAGQLYSLPAYGWPADWYSTWTERVKAVQLGAMDGVAKEYCNVDDYLIVVAGDWKTVGSTLGAFGLPIIMYSNEGKRLGERAPDPPPLVKGAQDNKTNEPKNPEAPKQ